MPDIKVSDVGTDFYVPTWDLDLKPPVNFDPSTATVKQIVFRMPQPDGTHKLLVRTATAAQRTIAGVATWCLKYTVLAADVAEYVSESVGGFHQAAGFITLEGHVEFGSS